MQLLLSFSALVASTMALSSVMLPLYTPPKDWNDSTKENPNWRAAFDAIASHPNLIFYVVINPASGPRGGNCDGHGCNKDWAGILDELHQHKNVQPIGYVSTGYGSRKPEEVEADITEWSQWIQAPTWSNPAGNISMYGIWFDETAVVSGGDGPASNKTLYTRYSKFTKEAFAKKPTSEPVTIVMNPGSNIARDYEADLYSLADAVVVRETCFTYLSTGPDPNGKCPGQYAAYEYRNLTQGCGLPWDDKLRSKTVNIVHEFHGPRPNNGPADETALKDQITGAVQLGLHSFYVTSGTWANTTLEPAAISRFSQLFEAANANTPVIPGGHEATNSCITTSIDPPAGVSLARAWAQFQA